MQADSFPPPLFTRLANSALGFSQNYGRFVVIAMLVLLHIAALRGVADNWARSLLLAHLGLLLIWQPFLRGQYQVSATQLGFISLGAVAVMLWLNAWLLVFWVCVLAGLVGGKVFLHQARWQRRFYLLVLFYLLALLAIVILPEIAPQKEITPELRMAAQYLLPILFVVMALLPAEPDPAEAPQVIDFFYSIFLMLVLGVVILGSFTFMTLGRTNYLEALTYTVFLIAGTVFIIGLAWNPHTGFAGLNVFFSRYLFSIGLPVEKWLYFLAELSSVESRPDRFLAESIASLARLSWVSGAEWRVSNDRGEHGQKTPFRVEYENSELSLTIYSRHRTSPALQWHLHLLGQLLGEFYLAKQREQKLQQQSYMQAVHETGARMTHDVKNLLQSLNVLVSVARQETGRDYSPELQALIRRQLPVIAQRLSATLEKLQRPQSESEQFITADAWWDSLRRQYSAHGVEFEKYAPRPGVTLLRSLADSIADNLIQNALNKRSSDPDIKIRVSLDCGESLDFRVCDSGRAVPPELEKLIFRAPVRSNSGLGIGLFQAARHAEANGYTLSLARNSDGEVCFALAGAIKLNPGP
ncbi:MAG: sensor histidine kinase [Proteobacteria bacterium]|nr:sensor histidine kinase [Pseudomonadota bacterium]